MHYSEKKRLIGATVISILLCITTAASAGNYTEADMLIDNSTKTIKQFIADPNMQALKDLLRTAQGIIIIPRMLRGGLVVGGTGGSGVLLARNMRTGVWSDPAFYSINSITFGLQIGAEESQIVMVIMTQRGLRSMLSSSFKLGADVTLAAGPVGGGAKAATADILGYAKSKGAFGGFTIEGAVMQTKDSWNTSFYGTPVTPSEILITHKVSSKKTEELKETISEASRQINKKIDY